MFFRWIIPAGYHQEISSIRDSPPGARQDRIAVPYSHSVAAPSDLYISSKLSLYGPARYYRLLFAVCVNVCIAGQVKFLFVPFHLSTWYVELPSLASYCNENRSLRDIRLFSRRRARSLVFREKKARFKPRLLLMIHSNKLTEVFDAPESSEKVYE